MTIKLCVGPISKQIVDSILEMTAADREKLAFIPSRRQVDFTGGYVNNWSTLTFSKYVSNKVLLQRDHGGPDQGNESDDGYRSFEYDSEYFQIIHVDPWKKYQKYEEGLLKTVELIEHLHRFNPKVEFEVGTEESIRRFEVDEFNKLLCDLKSNLKESSFNKIRYGVVQSGVGLDLLNLKNTGTYSADRLKSMVQICKNHGILSKEHNGDYLTAEEIKNRYSQGLDTINIAPEFGQIETIEYYNSMTEEQAKVFYDLCYKSKRWEKWISKKETSDVAGLIRVCSQVITIMFFA